MIAMKYLVATTVLGLVGSAQSQPLSDPLSVAKVTTTDQGLVINTYNDASSCANPTELFLKRQGPNYDRNVQIFIQGWTSGKSVRATVDGCTSDGAGEVDGWQIAVDPPTEFDDPVLTNKSTNIRDIKKATIVQFRVDLTGNAYVRLSGEEVGVRPACVSTTNGAFEDSMAFDTTTTAGQVMLRTLTEAHAQKHLASYYGKSTCDIYGAGAGIQDLNYIVLVEDVFDDPDEVNEVYTGTITELIAGNDGVEGFILRMDVSETTACASNLSYFRRERSNNFDSKVSLAIAAFSMGRSVRIVGEKGYSSRCRIMQMTLQ